MTSKNSFPVLKSTASKAEEIEHLEKFAASLEAGTYLASTFTPNLIGLITQNIRADVCPDLHEWIVMGDAELCRDKEAAEAENEELKARVAALQNDLEAEKLHNGGLIHDLREEVSYRTKQADRQAEDIYNLQGMLAQKESENQALKAEIMRLKAKLYDLVVENGAAE